MHAGRETSNLLYLYASPVFAARSPSTLGFGQGEKQFVQRSFHRLLVFFALAVGNGRFRRLQLGGPRPLRRRENSGRGENHFRPVPACHGGVSVRSLGDEGAELAAGRRLLPAPVGDCPVRMGDPRHQAKTASSRLCRETTQSCVPLGTIRLHPPPLLYGLFALLAGMRRGDFVAPHGYYVRVSRCDLYDRCARRGAQFPELLHAR
jgi:hypothetical protein